MLSRRSRWPLLTPFCLALLAVGVLAVVSGCGGSEPSASSEPRPQAAAPAAAPATELATALDGPTVIALGSVQDGGLPHAGCTCERCEAARHDPARRRAVASLGLVIPRGDGAPQSLPPAVYLVDATPDVGAQLHRLLPYRVAPAGRVDRTPIDGVLLTHAHIGHYLGLAQFGFEVMHASGVAAYCTPRMAAFLRANGPWSQLVAKQELELRETVPGETVELEGGVSFTPLLVPHRDEFSDTVGYLLRGPRRTLLYVPDTDSWDAWATPLPAVLAAEGVDVLLPDATFFSLDELPGRDIGSIGHPLVTQTIELLGGEVAAGRLEVYFTHLNHSNPALDPASPARRQIEEAGFGVLREGQRFPL